MKKKWSAGEKGVLFLLALFVLFRIPSWYTHWQINQGIDSFQGQTTEFTINTSIPLPYVRLDSGQLTQE